MTRFSIIVAFDSERNIGRNGGIPFRIASDMRYFREKTMGSTIIMGRKTWESIGSRPLRGRRNVVISRTLEAISDAEIARSLDEAIESATAPIFVIGGGEIYKMAIEHPSCEILYITRLFTKFDDCDTSFPQIPKVFEMKSCSERKTELNVDFQFEVWKK